MPATAVVSIAFGTTHMDALQDIQKTEEQLAQSMPGLPLFRAFTSRKVIRALHNRQMDIPDPPQLLEQLAKSGYRRLICQPLHIIPGIEYHKLMEELTAATADFDQILVGKPLLDTQQDHLQVAQAILQNLPDWQDGDGLILMGHGTEHSADVCYQTLQQTLCTLGAGNIFVGTVEGRCTLPTLLPALHRAGLKKIHLMPFLLVAGDHAKEDMAGDAPDSWRSILLSEGFSVQCHLQGLGSIPQIRALFCRHALQAQPITR